MEALDATRVALANVRLSDFAALDAARTNHAAAHAALRLAKSRRMAAQAALEEAERDALRRARAEARAERQRQRVERQAELDGALGQLNATHRARIASDALAIVDHVEAIVAEHNAAAARIAAAEKDAASGARSP